MQDLALAPDGSWLALNLDAAAVASAWSLPALAPRVLRLDPALPLGHERDLDLLRYTQSQLHVTGITTQKSLNLIRDALDRAGGVVAHAAQLLGLRRTTLVEKLRKYGVEREDAALATEN